MNYFDACDQENVSLGNIIFQYANVLRRSFHCMICECIDLVNNHITLRYTGSCPNIGVSALFDAPKYVTISYGDRSFMETIVNP